MPFAPSALTGVGVSIADDVERRQLGGGREGVAEEARGQRVARPRRRRTPRRAPGPTPVATPPCTWPSAMTGLIDRARVVDRDEAPELDLAGLGVDLDDGDVRAERERRSARVEDLLGAQLLEPSFRCRGSWRAPSRRARAWASRPRGSARSRCRARRRRRSPRAARLRAPGPAPRPRALPPAARRRRRSGSTSSRRCRCPGGPRRCRP